MKRILVINPFGIGDVIFSTPLIAALKKNFPDSFIGYLCNKRAYEVIKSNPNIDKIFVCEKDDFRELWDASKFNFFREFWKFLRTIKRENFDVAIDLSLNYQTGLYLKLIGLPERVGFNYRNRGKFLTRKIDIEGFNDKHVIEYYLDILRLFDIDPAPYRDRPWVYVTETDKSWATQFLANHGICEKDTVIGIIPGCGASWGVDAGHRRWSVEGFAKVCDALAERHHARIVLMGDAREAVLGERIQKLTRQMPIIACGKTTIGDFLGLIKRCDLVITNDGGPLHMAVGVGTRTVSIFGPVDERIYGPYPDDPNHVAVAKKDLPCRPCYRKFKYNICEKKHCLKNITPTDVLNAVDEVLAR